MKYYQSFHDIVDPVDRGAQCGSSCIGGGQRTYVLFRTSDVVAALLTTPVAVVLLQRFGANKIPTKPYMLH